MSQSKITQLTLAPKEAYRLFRISADLADMLEDILESRGNYSPEFLKGLKLSLKQAKIGKSQKVNSLSALR